MKEWLFNPATYMCIVLFGALLYAGWMMLFGTEVDES